VGAAKDYQTVVGRLLLIRVNVRGIDFVESEKGAMKAGPRAWGIASSNIRQRGTELHIRTRYRRTLAHLPTPVEALKNQTGGFDSTQAQTISSVFTNHARSGLLVLGGSLGTHCILRGHSNHAQEVLVDGPANVFVLCCMGKGTS
jgi:hypothetical protein